MFVLLVDGKYDSIWNNKNEDDFLHGYLEKEDIDISRVEVLEYSKKEFNEIQVEGSKKKKRITVDDLGEVSVCDIATPLMKTVTNPSWKTPHPDDGMSDADYLAQKAWDEGAEAWLNDPKNFDLDNDGNKIYTGDNTIYSNNRPFDGVQVELHTPEVLKATKKINYTKKTKASEIKKGPKYKVKVV